MAARVIRERSPHVRQARFARAEAQAGVVQTLNPITSGTWKLSEIITMIGFADAKTAKKMLTKGQIKVNDKVVKKDDKHEIGELILTVGDCPAVRVIGG